MSTIIAILKNNYYRMQERKNYTVIMMLLTFITISFAVFFSAKAEVVGNIALVTSEENAAIPNITALKITVLTRISATAF